MPGIRITVKGDAEVMAKLRQISKSGMARAMQRAMSTSVMKVYRRAAINLTGTVLNVQSGRLRQSLSTSVASDGTSASIGTNVEYAAIHEFGGRTPPHEIRPRSAKALRFVTPGFIGPMQLTKKGTLSRRASSGVTFAKVVRHPGSVMPARPYLRPALQDSIPDIEKSFQNELSKALEGE